VMVNRCHTSRRPVITNNNISTAREARVNSTVANTNWRGSRSATAPANKEMKLVARRTEEVKPTKNGESVIVNTSQATTNVSIWDPIPANMMEVQTMPKLRCRSVDSGWASLFRAGGSLN
jgi:hypothetical protein